MSLFSCPAGSLDMLWKIPQTQTQKLDFRSHLDPFFFFVFKDINVVISLFGKRLPVLETSRYLNK